MWGCSSLANLHERGQDFITILSFLLQRTQLLLGLLLFETEKNGKEKSVIQQLKNAPLHSEMNDAVMSLPLGFL